MSETIEGMPTSGDRRDLQALANELMERARTEGVDLVGQGGLLSDLTKTVLETVLKAELTEHLGYDEHDRSGCGGSGNSRNGTRTKAVTSGLGLVRVDAPRGRAGSFEPVIVKKGQRPTVTRSITVTCSSGRGAYPCRP